MNKPLPVQKGLLFLMRLTLLQLVISSFSMVMAYATDGMGQEILDRKITLKVEGTAFQNVLVLISKQANVKFAYSPEIVEEEKKVSVNVQNTRLADVLSTLLGPEVSFKVIGKQIVLMPLSELAALEEKERTAIESNPVQKVTGKVTDATGAPIPGVNVVVKGTTTGTVTDADGVYSFDIPDGDVTLVFSFIGYATQEVAVGGRATIDVTLEDDIMSLGEVVVVGYGTQEKKEVTGAISQVSGNEIRKSSAVSISNSLAGQVPGLFVNQTNAEPGRDDASIYVRGIGTTGNTAALIVVDGIANRDAISRIDPNDIESITVLKDASAAIYGAQAANGVILITTKKGKSGKPTITYSFNQGFVSPTRKLKLADAALYAKSVNIWRASEGQAALYTDEEIAAFESGASPSTDWIDEVYKSYYLQSRHSLTLNGGSDNTTYFLSVGATNQNGLTTGDETSHYKQYNVRSNVESQVSKQLKIGLNLAGRREDRRWLQYEDQTIYSNTVRAIPTIPATLYGLPAEGRQGFNPLAIAKGPGYLSLIRNVLNGTITGEYKIKQVEGLSVDGFAAIDIVQDFEKHFNQPFTYYTDTNNDGVPEAVQGGPSLSGTYLRQDYVGSQSVTLNAKIKYERTFGVHSVAGFLAYEQNESKGDNFYAQRNQYTSSQIDQLFAGSANTDYFGIDGRAYETARQNYFGRFNYTYNDRYIAQFHFRYDGSSNFPSNKRFGFFPGVSVGWRISEESFLNSSQLVSNLKLRASWGKLGNDRIDPFQYLNTLSYPGNPANGYVIGGGNVNVLNPGVAANPNITWETKTTLDVGLDAGFLENRLTLEFDVFSESRKDILAYRNATVPNYTGLTLPMENIAEVDNKGFDAQVMYRGKVSDVSFNVGGNMSFARNKIIFSDERDLYVTIDDYKRQSTEGHPVGAALVYDYIGIYRTAEDLTTYPGLTAPALGDPIFRDLNEDGVVNNLDRYRLDRTSVPQFQYGITLGAQYKGFDFTAVFQGQARAIQFVRYTFNEGNNGLEYFLENAWSPENPGAALPAFNQGNSNSEMSTLWRRDVSFLRLKNIELGYTLPQSLVSKVGIEKLRFYLNGYNLLTFDKLKKDGMSDPEATNLEAWQYPHTKSINFGLNLTF
jgi:TonB-linked SusC/RagA family outer membrane protein